MENNGVSGHDVVQAHLIARAEGVHARAVETHPLDNPYPRGSDLLTSFLEGYLWLS